MCVCEILCVFVRVKRVRALVRACMRICRCVCVYVRVRAGACAYACTACVRTCVRASTFECVCGAALMWRAVLLGVMWRD